MAISLKGLQERIRRLGKAPLETDLAPYEKILTQIDARGRTLRSHGDQVLRERSTALRNRACHGEAAEGLLVEAFALAREAADRILGLRPFGVQVMAAVALHRGRLVEMQTGEGKTLAAVLPAYLNGLGGRGVHVLTFNDYLARRDASWMGPVYRFLGSTVEAVQEGMDAAARKAAYGADVTYVTAKEAGFDFLRMHLCRDPSGIAHRPFHYAIVDEADSLLIDEARVPLVIAGSRNVAGSELSRIAALVRGLHEGIDWETDENRRNVFLTEDGLDRVAAELGRGGLHRPENYLLLTEVSQALHAHALLARDVDYIVRNGRIELVDEFTGRVVGDRRWPDGLQAALEAKEGLAVRAAGQVLGSITLQHYLRQYPRLCGMTATARTAAEELDAVYGLKVTPIPSNRPCVRRDLPDVIFTHKGAKLQALAEEIARAHGRGQPVLVGTGSVDESAQLASALRSRGLECQVLNAKNDEKEAEIVARAGAPGALTISTNMAGRGTDIRLGGPGEEERDRVVGLGGLYVIGTARHESRRIDDQLRGRAGRQGDPGRSRFLVSLEDDLMVRFRIDGLIPAALRPPLQSGSIDRPVIRREMDRVQRIAEGQAAEIRSTLLRYAELVEIQRRELQGRRMAVLLGGEPPVRCAECAPARYAQLRERLGAEALRALEREIALHEMDRCWAEHLAFVSHVREGIHLAGLGGARPLEEFGKQIAVEFARLKQRLENRIVEKFDRIRISADGVDLDREELRGPSSTWTYLVNDRALSDLQQMLAGPGGFAFAAVATLTTGWLLAAWALFCRYLQKKKHRTRRGA